jgi:hypothetical protein
MTTERDDGGPAFPSMERVGEIVQVAHEGMSLRDYFAAKVVQAYLTFKPDIDNKKAATWAYGVADAMIAARK